MYRGVICWAVDLCVGLTAQLWAFINTPACSNNTRDDDDTQFLALRIRRIKTRLISCILSRYVRTMKRIDRHQENQSSLSRREQQQWVVNTQVSAWPLIIELCDIYLISGCCTWITMRLNCKRTLSTTCKEKGGIYWTTISPVYSGHTIDVGPQHWWSVRSQSRTAIATMIKTRCACGSAQWAVHVYLLLYILCLTPTPPSLPLSISLCIVVALRFTPRGRSSCLSKGVIVAVRSVHVTCSSCIVCMVQIIMYDLDTLQFTYIRPMAMPSPGDAFFL